MGNWFDLKGDARLGRCATDGCGGQPTKRLEADGVGANYCSGCAAKIDALSASTTPSGEVEGLVEMPADLKDFARDMPINWPAVLESRAAAGYLNDTKGTRDLLRATAVYTHQASTALASMKREVERLTQANEALMQERTSLIETKREHIAQHRQDASDYLDALVKSEARIKVLEEALKPFADRCDEAVRPDDAENDGVTVKTKFLRAASQALGRE